MLGMGFRSITIAKVGYTTACVAAAATLVVSGFAGKLVGLAHGLNGGASLGDSSSVGEMNVLMMGLESRTNFEGQRLSAGQLTETHSGNVSSVSSGEVGSQDTDTLILMHIFAGGKKAVGFSIPRDDLVTYPHATYDGLTEGKIDQAYAYAYDQSLQSTYGTNASSSQRYLEANQAGQLFEIETVESVTGVHIDHFVESNLIGFYTLAQAFGGIEVCIKPAPAQGGFAPGANLTDYDPLVYPPTDNSGFSAYEDGYSKAKGGAQYLHLSAAQSLAFVRSRDTLPGVDIGRTARQQAVIDYVIYEVKHENYLTDIGKLTALLGGASQYLITDSNFNLIDFAPNMGALSGKNVKFTTLPATAENNVPVPGFPNGEDVNVINVPQIQKEVQHAFYPAPNSSATPAASTVTVDVYNGSGAGGLAGDVSQAFAARGYKTGAVSNSSSQSQSVTDDTQVFYGDGASANAGVIANEMGVTKGATSLSSLPAGHVEVLLGSQVTGVPSGIEASSPGASSGSSGSASSAGGSAESVGASAIGAKGAAASAGASSVSRSSSSVSSRASGSGSGSGSVTVGPNAKYGIPCVY